MVHLAYKVLFSAGTMVSVYSMSVQGHCTSNQMYVQSWLFQGEWQMCCSPVWLNSTHSFPPLASNVRLYWLMAVQCAWMVWSAAVCTMVELATGVPSSVYHLAVYPVLSSKLGRSPYSFPHSTLLLCWERRSPVSVSIERDDYNNPIETIQCCCSAPRNCVRKEGVWIAGIWEPPFEGAALTPQWHLGGEWAKTRW